MRILIANDDGVLAPGLKALHGALHDYADCVVVAPHEDRSGASSALTLDKPLRPFYLENGFVGLNGTPTDCVHLGVNSLFPDSIDMVVAGINLGANLGDDVLYSGTVAAALEGRFLTRPAMAFSLVGRQTDNLAAAATIARQLVEAHDQLELPPRTVLNEHTQSAAGPDQGCGSDAAGAPAAGGQAGEVDRSAGQGRLLDLGGRRCRGWGRGNGFQRSDAGICVGDAPAC